MNDKIDSEKYPVLAEYTDPVLPPVRDIIGREQEIKDIRAGLLRAELNNILLLGQAGSGKALDNSTLIPVNDSRLYVPIGKLKYGDEVFDENGNPTKVCGVYPQGELEAWEVEFENGQKVICNDEHMWNVCRVFKDNVRSPFRTMTLGEVLKYDETFRLCQDKIIHDGAKYLGFIPEKEKCNDSYFEWGIPYGKSYKTRNGISNRKIYSKFYLTGVYAATNLERYLKMTSSSSSWFSVDDTVKDRRLSFLKKNIVSTWQNLSGHRKMPYNRDVSDLNIGKHGISYYKYNSYSYFFLSDFIQLWKTVNEWDIDSKFSFLRGFLDWFSDVDVNNTGIRIDFSKYVCSDKVVFENPYALNSLLYERKTYWKEESNYDIIFENFKRLFFRFFNELGFSTSYNGIVFHVSHVSVNYIEAMFTNKILDVDPVEPMVIVDLVNNTNEVCKKGRDYLKITNIKKLDKKLPMTCIYVDSPTHLYQCTKNHIVTHNTSLVQQVSVETPQWTFLEIDVSRLISKVHDVKQAGTLLKSLFDEAERYVKAESHELVLFMDEFHQIVNISAAAVEALKPVLAASGARGIRVIAATTFEEFLKYVSENQALVERLQRVNIRQTTNDATMTILKEMAKKYKVDNMLSDDIYYRIVDYTNRYVPASSQPRKSILVLDGMIGKHRSEGRNMDFELLVDVLKTAQGVDVAFAVDIYKLKEYLNSKVLSQKFAIDQLCDRLGIVTADLNDPKKPLSSILFSGSTGVIACSACA